MRRFTRLLLALAILVLSNVAQTQTGHAQPKPDPPPAADDASLTKAKELFRRGVAMMKAEDMERALDLFQQSRDAYASVQNTSNAAICLDSLGRYDEALELYELILTDFKDKLTSQEATALAPAMKKLRSKVGGVFISANVEGIVIIDGRKRGRLPLNVAIRVLPGERSIQVIKDGYKPFAAKRTVKAGKTVKVDASLQPLADAGLLRIEDPDHEGSSVFVDGSKVGTTPWQGTLGPGAHLVWTYNATDKTGSSPTAVTVVQGQKATVTINSVALGGARKVVVTPKKATLKLGKVALGKGQWEGHLPAGSYTIVAEEPGYFVQSKTVDVVAGDDEATISFALVVDENHPRWPKGVVGDVIIEAFGGVALGSLGYDSAFESADGLAAGASRVTNCTGCESRGTLGMMVGLRGAYQFDMGLSIELAAGYLSMSTSDQRNLSLSDAGSLNPTFILNEDMIHQGPFAGLGVGYRLGLGDVFGLKVRAMGGVFVSYTRYTMNDSLVQVVDMGVTHQANLSLSGGTLSTNAATAFAHLDAGFDLRFDPVYFGLTMGVLFLPTPGPKLSERTLDVSNEDPCNDAMGNVNNPAACTKTNLKLPEEDAFTLSVLPTPQAHVGVRF